MLGVKMIKNRSEIINYEEGNKYQPFKMRTFDLYTSNYFVSTQLQL